MDVRNRRRESRVKLSEFLLLALLIHLAVLPWLPVPPSPDPGKKATRVRLVSIGKASSAQNQRKPKKRRAEEEKRQEEEKKKEDLAKLEGQIVDIPPSADDRPPEDAEFLSEHNTRTERETRSRHQSADFKNPLNEVSVTEAKIAAREQASVDPAKAIEIGPPQKEKQPKSTGGIEPVFELPRLKQRDRLALQLDPSLGTFRNQAESDRLEGKGETLRLSLGSDTDSVRKNARAPQQGPASVNLMPQVGVLAKLSGGPANDKLDLEEGEGTFLNSREFKFASFFNRMKRGVSQHWRPMIEYRRRDPTGNIYGQRPRVTVLSVTLNSDGSLRSLEVSRSSGVDFLDREAIAAFRRAEPFPNPPRGLVDDGGEIAFPFGFHIEFTASGGMRLPF